MLSRVAFSRSPASPCMFQALSNMSVLTRLLLVSIYLPSLVAVGKQPRGAVDDAPLIDQLIEQLCLGRNSCKKVTEIARASLKPATDGLKAVARIPSGRNSERALQNWAKQEWRKLLPELYEFSLPLAESWHERDAPLHAALLPHEVFASLHSYPPDLFECLLTGGDNSLRQC